jgi:hypothetical protein
MLKRVAGMLATVAGLVCVLACGGIGPKPIPTSAESQPGPTLASQPDTKQEKAGASPKSTTGRAESRKNDVKPASE